MTEEGKKAIRRALNIISYTPNTERQLIEKLTEKGHGPGAVKEAIDYLKAKGYVNEREHMFRLVDRLGNIKGYGKRRIFMALKQKGFNDALIDECFDEACEQVDFVEACARRLRDDRRTDEKKILASLQRYGYDYETIKAAKQRIVENEQE
ncbi:MAG: hypothetical protein HFE78_00400 [Clostridiales bacterium]|nr:hypothetical protein [Clostridiales bacterium]